MAEAEGGKTKSFPLILNLLKEGRAEGGKNGRGKSRRFSQQLSLSVALFGGAW